MKLFRNDKTTRKDELFLFGFILACLAAGITLLITQPSFWVIHKSISMGMGLILTVTGAMFIPGLIYRLLTNDTSHESLTGR